MDPKKAQDIRAMLSQQFVGANLMALAYYARLLKTCGVKSIRIREVHLIPGMD